MRRKLLVTALVLIMALNLIACGQATKEESAKTPDTTVTEEVVNQEVTETEENVEPVETMEEEGAEEQVVEEEEVFTEEDALARVNLLIEAYNELAKSEKEVEWCILDRCEKLSYVGKIDVKTKDGYELNGSDEFPNALTLSHFIAFNYFYDFINNNGSYYDFTNYIESNSFNEILTKNINEDYLNKELENNDSNTSLLCTAVALANYLKQFNNIEVVEFIEGENCTSNPVSGIEVFYEAKLICDNEDIGLKALFDKDGNLINIYLPDEAGDPRVFTFPE